MPASFPPFAAADLAQSLLPRAEAEASAPDALASVQHGLGAGPFACVILFLSPLADLPQLAQSLIDLGPSAFGGAPVIGCTTAGEIGAQGYAEGLLVAVGLPAAHFSAAPLLIDDLAGLDGQALISRIIRARAALEAQRPDWDSEFAFLMVDGLSVREDELVSVVAQGLGPVPMFGGSAADGTRFHETFVLYEGQLRRNAAVLTMIRTACGVRVFNFDHLLPTQTRMVVTQALPKHRIVRQINAEPAAQEYARLLGKDPAQLTPFTFAAHPVVVRIGGKHHVRAIQQMAENGDLVFFSAIDEGLVLTLAEPQDMETHLAAALQSLSHTGAPAAILACDCILRRMEAQEKQKTSAISALLRAHHVSGFSTYGEQMNGMHVNQTLTGVALYPPDPALAGSGSA